MRRVLLSLLFAIGLYAQYPRGGGGSGSGVVATGTPNDIPYYTGINTLGPMSGGSWTDASRLLQFTDGNLDFLIGTDPWLSISTDNNAGDSYCGALFVMNCSQVGPATVSGATGTSGRYVEISGLKGGDTSIVSSGTGGDASNIRIIGQAGGAAPNAVNTQTSGNGSIITIRSGLGTVAANAANPTGGESGEIRVEIPFGGNATSTGGGGTAAVGGSAGNGIFQGGDGGNASGGATNTPGTGSSWEFFLGTGGSGDAAGLDGTFKINTGGNANSNIIKINAFESASYFLILNKSGNLVSGADSVAPTITGCTAAAIVAGATAMAGEINGTPTGACVVTLTFATAAPHGYRCEVDNMTTANLFRQTAKTQTTAVITGTTVANDVLTYMCWGW